MKKLAVFALLASVLPCIAAPGEPVAAQPVNVRTFSPV